MGKVKNQNIDKVIVGAESYNPLIPKWKTPREILQEMSEIVFHLHNEMFERDGDLRLADYNQYKRFRSQIEILHGPAFPFDHPVRDFKQWKEYRKKESDISWLEVTVQSEDDWGDLVTMNWGEFIKKAYQLCERGNFWPVGATVSDIQEAGDFLSFMLNACLANKEKDSSQ